MDYGQRVHALGARHERKDSEGNPEQKIGRQSNTPTYEETLGRVRASTRWSTSASACA